MRSSRTSPSLTHRRRPSLCPRSTKATSACGTKEVGGALKDCKDKVNSQFDLVPLFTVAKGKQAVNCAPYSHSHPDKLKPTPVKSQAEAQQKCAADKSCKFYMYIDSDAADAPADDRGKVP